MCRLLELCDSSVCCWLLSLLVLTRTQSGQHRNAAVGDFTSVFFIYKNASWCTKQTRSAITMPFCFAKNTSWLDSLPGPAQLSVGRERERVFRSRMERAWERGYFVMSTLLLVLLNWLHSKITSAAAFHIIGLTKISKIEFLPRDWIYRSTRIMTVSNHVPV